MDTKSVIQLSKWFLLLELVVGEGEKMTSPRLGFIGHKLIIYINFHKKFTLYSPLLSSPPPSKIHWEGGWGEIQKFLQVGPHLPSKT